MKLPTNNKIVIYNSKLINEIFNTLVVFYNYET